MGKRIRRPPLNSLIAQAESAGRKVTRVVYPPAGGFELVLEDENTVAGRSWQPATQAEAAE
jgi:hypothetical protein